MPKLRDVSIEVIQDNWGRIYADHNVSGDDDDERIANALSSASSRTSSGSGRNQTVVLGGRDYNCTQAFDFGRIGLESAELGDSGSKVTFSGLAAGQSGFKFSNYGPSVSGIWVECADDQAIGFNFDSISSPLIKDIRATMTGSKAIGVDVTRNGGTNTESYMIDGVRASAAKPFVWQSGDNINIYNYWLECTDPDEAPIQGNLTTTKFEHIQFKNGYTSGGNRAFYFIAPDAPVTGQAGLVFHNIDENAVDPMDDRIARYTFRFNRPGS